MKMRGTRNAKRLWFRGRTARRGAAVVEMAVVSPLLLAMLLGMIEFGYVFMVQQSITNGVREACRLGTLSGITDAQIQERFEEAIAATGLEITSGMFTIEHATLADPTVKVSVQVPYEDVTLLGVLPSSLFTSFFGGEDAEEGGPETIGEKMIGSSCSMRKEGAL